MTAGMAAGFGGLFRTPLAAAFFAAEVFTAGSLEYEAIVPAVTAAFTASEVSGMLGLGKFTFALSCDPSISVPAALKLVLMGILFGLTGLLFAFSLSELKKKFAAIIPNAKLRIGMIGSAVGLISILILGGRYSGLGTNLISAGFSSGILPYDFILKLIFTVVTLAAGFYGGEVTPLFSIGTALGYALAAFLGMPCELCAALGYAAVFGSATNTLLAPIFIGVEVFGYEYLPLFIIVCVIAYMCNGGRSIYSLQRVRERN